MVRVGFIYYLIYNWSDLQYFNMGLTLRFEHYFFLASAGLSLQGVIICKIYPRSRCSFS
jgi:hypothetical protein